MEDEIIILETRKTVIYSGGKLVSAIGKTRRIPWK